MKLIVELFFALVLIVLLSPILLLISLLIILIDWHSPFFIQERLGRYKKMFTIIKFRSMKNGEITFFGKILRKTGMDEIPQLFNIMMGQMSFVGPRPLTAADVKRLNWETEYYNKRWSLKPGIVGLAQLSPVCHKKVSWWLDKQYIEKQGVKLDTKILLASVLIPFVGKTQLKKWMHKR
ncbi:MAG: sugar transferase [Crocinitomicaceae bacterium]